MSHAIRSFTLMSVAVAVPAVADATIFTSEAAFLPFVDPCTRVTVRFDNLPHDTQLFGQLAGLSFGGTGRTWDAANFGGGGTFQSPPNVLFNYGTAPITITLTTAVTAIGCYNPSLFDVINLQLFDAQGGLITTVQMPSFSAGVTYAGVVSTTPIKTVVAAGVAGQSNLTIFLDTMTFGQATTCAADLNDDGVVNAADLGLLLGAWSSSGACFDLNADGVVNAADLAIVLGAWGPCSS